MEGNGDGAAQLACDSNQSIAGIDRDYDRLLHARAYIRLCAKQRGLYGRRVADRHVLQEALAAVQPKRMEKFQRERENWNDGSQPIPISYLRFIGVDFGRLQTEVEQDGRRWDQAMNVASTPTYFSVHRGSMSRVIKPLSPGLSEEEITEAVRMFLDASPEYVGGRVNWPGLQAILLFRGKAPEYLYGRPSMKTGGGFVHLG